MGTLAIHMYWQLNFAQIRASDKFLSPCWKFHPPTDEGCNEGNWFNYFIYKFKQKLKLNDDAEVTGTLVLTMPRKDNPAHCQTRNYICGWIFWQSLMIFLGNRKNSELICRLMTIIQWITTGRFISTLRKTSSWSILDLVL